MHSYHRYCDTINIMFCNATVSPKIIHNHQNGVLATSLISPSSTTSSIPLSPLYSSIEISRMYILLKIFKFYHLAIVIKYDNQTNDSKHYLLGLFFILSDLIDGFMHGNTEGANRIRAVYKIGVGVKPIGC